MNSEILKKYNTLLTESSFIPAPSCEQFGSAGSCWKLSPELGGGHYWLYAQKDLFDIKIHDFYFHNDFVLRFDIPEGISITRYDSMAYNELFALAFVAPYVASEKKIPPETVQG